MKRKDGDYQLSRLLLATLPAGSECAVPFFFSSSPIASKSDIFKVLVSISRKSYAFLCVCLGDSGKLNKEPRKFFFRSSNVLCDYWAYGKVYVCVYVCTYVRMCVCVCAYVYVYVYVYIYVWHMPYAFLCLC